MTDKEIRLTIKMLQAYIDYHLSPAGCNDTDPEWLKEFTEPELIELHREFHDWNGDPEELYETARPLADFCYVYLIQKRLEEMIGK
jgi:hypothetical protein